MQHSCLWEEGGREWAWELMTNGNFNFNFLKKKDLNMLSVNSLFLEMGLLVVHLFYALFCIA